jgi:hypothetical protein
MRTLAALAASPRERLQPTEKTNRLDPQKTLDRTAISERPVAIPSQRLAYKKE